MSTLSLVRVVPIINIRVDHDDGIVYLTAIMPSSAKVSHLSFQGLLLLLLLVLVLLFEGIYDKVYTPTLRHVWWPSTATAAGIKRRQDEAEQDGRGKISWSSSGGEWEGFFRNKVDSYCFYRSVSSSLSEVLLLFFSCGLLPYADPSTTVNYYYLYPKEVLVPWSTS